MTTTMERSEDCEASPAEQGPTHRVGRPSYGIDGPVVAASFGVLAVLFGAVGASVASSQGAVAAIGPWGAALLCVLAIGLLKRSSSTGKATVLAREIDRLGLRGDERVADVGCGRGLATIAFAGAVPRGSVVGVMSGRRGDRSGSRRARAEANAELEGVASRVEFVDGDAHDLPFADGEFDVVTACLTFRAHALAADRATAMAELMRITKPGGRVLIIDNAHTAECEAWLRHGEWDELERRGPSFQMYPPVRVVSARKPAPRVPKKNRSKK